MTKQESQQVLRWIAGFYPSWLSKVSDQQAEGTTEIYLRHLEPLPFARSFTAVQKLCLNEPDFAPSPAKVVAACGVLTDEDQTAFLKAMASGEQLTLGYRQVGEHSTEWGWGTTPTLQLREPNGVAALPVGRS